MKYADKYNYQFIDASDYAASLLIEKKDANKRKNWLKVAVIMNYINKFDWVFYVDIDTWIDNFDVSLHMLLRGVKEEDYMVITRDYCGLNSGVFFIRNSVAAHELLTEWISYSYIAPAVGMPNLEVKERVAFPKDQRALKHIYNIRAGEKERFSLNKKKVHECGSVSMRPVKGFRFLKQCAMNSSPEVGVREATYAEGDFIVHLFGCKSKSRNALIRALDEGSFVPGCVKTFR
eukprot:CAMPEP_0174256366 /NCGR_PEP_ID=MMETSP0439-20130205/5607_1 /TAXON_ID=0 /ORGANISM="Stereomyxa ramosa, Strain Chinc5" /LENGTH=232 /DNA_ID=CAMNT_0015338943 /DNA_START=277 /DNA_END=975 /DNA_ORIENTATION=+